MICGQSALFAHRPASPMTCGAVFQRLLRAEQMIQHFNICAAGGAQGGNARLGSDSSLMRRLEKPPRAPLRLCLITQSSRMLYRQRQPRRPKPAGLPPRIRGPFHPRRALPPRAPLRLCHITPLPLTHYKTATTPQTEACGVASAYPRSIPSEAGLAPSGSPAALSHNSAATDSLQNSDNPADRSLRGCLSMTLQAQRSVFLNWDAGELRLGQITPTALPSSRQTAS